MPRKKVVREKNKMRATEANTFRLATKYIPGMTQTLSKGPDRFVNGVTPKFLRAGQDAHVYDCAWNKFIDWPMGLGAVILGYRNPEVDKAVREAVLNGPTFTLPHYSEAQLAEVLYNIIPSAQMVRFCKNGSDADEGAVRIARAYTNRKHVALCGYAGSHDWSAITGGLKRGLIDSGFVHTFNYNDPESLEQVLTDFDCACVIMEQGLEKPTWFLKKGHTDRLGQQNFLQVAANKAHAHGAVFILDEIVTGFRYGMGGAARLFDVLPDITTIGKAMGNGYSIAAICGKKELMQTLTEGVFFSFTFAGETIGIAAALATIEVLRENWVRAPSREKLWTTGSAIRIGIQKAADNVGLKINLRGNNPRSVLEIPGPDGKNDLLAYSLFLQETVKRGILFGIPIFPCLTHTEKDVDDTIQAVWETFEIIKKAEGEYGRLLEGEPIAPPVIRA